MTKLAHGVAFAVAGMLVCGDARAQDQAVKAQVDMAISLLEFGVIPARLVWDAATQKRVAVPDTSDGASYVRAAQVIQQELERGRTGSSLIKANAEIISASLKYAAIVDPEPLSKVTLGVAAYGAHQAGSYFGDKAIEASRKQAHGVLRAAMNESKIDITKVTPERIAKEFKDWKVGGQALSKVFERDPEALRMIEAHAQDLRDQVSFETFKSARATEQSVADIKETARRTSETLQSFREETAKRLDEANEHLQRIERLAQDSKARLVELGKDVAQAKRATQTLAQISYMGWTTEQKLSAVRAGMFPDLDPQQAGALEKSLVADLQREQEIRSLQRVAGEIGKLSQIAGNLGLSPSIATGLSAAQIGVSAVAQFVSGDYLGSLASATSLLGLGKPNAAAQQQQQMMAYLDKQFGRINEKLDKMLELQRQTLSAVIQVHTELVAVREKVEVVETIVFQNNALLRRLAMEKWDPCGSLFASLNGKYAFSNKQQLVHAVQDPSNRISIPKCFALYDGALTRWRNTDQWASDVIDAAAHPNMEEVAGVTKEAAVAYKAYLDSLKAQRQATRDFLRVALPDKKQTIAEVALRFSQPMVNVDGARMIATSLRESTVKLADLSCGDVNAPSAGSKNAELSIGLKRLICFAEEGGKPSQSTWDAIVAAPALGPYVRHMIDLGIPLSMLSDFGRRQTEQDWSFTSSEDLSLESREGLQRLVTAVGQGKGESLLTNLMTLTDAYVLQQGMLYGDYTAELVAEVLYDRSTNALTTDKGQPGSKVALARALMKVNPALARNVVTIALNQAFSSAGMSETYFNIARSRVAGSEACDKGSIAWRGLKEKLPNWKLEYRAYAADRQKDKPMEKCPAATDDSEVGWGLSVDFEDFYVKVPATIALKNGNLDSPPSLRLALAYRDRVAQALLDRTLSKRPETQPLLSRDRTALMLVGEGASTPR